MKLNLRNAQRDIFFSWLFNAGVAQRDIEEIYARLSGTSKQTDLMSLIATANVFGDILKRAGKAAMEVEVLEEMAVQP